MGITTTTAAGRAQLAHPDLGHDGGTLLWNKVQALFAKVGDSLATQWFGPFTVADTASEDLTHNFDMAVEDLDIRIVENDVLLTLEQQSVYSITGKTGNLKNAVTITNNSGGSKTFDVYILGFNLDKMMGRQKGRIVTTDGSNQNILAIRVPAGEAMGLDVLVSCRKDGTTANFYHLLGIAEHNGAEVTSVRTTEFTQDEDAPGCTVFLSYSGHDALVRVNGESGVTWEWNAVVQKTYF
jgi:hypothetical protein